MIIVCIGFMLSSCAYIQTHKNVEEIGSYFNGQVFNRDQIALYQSGDQWYISATQALFKLRYPMVHDSVFRKYDENPTYKLTRKGPHSTVYHPISAATAEVLRRPDGYFQLTALAEEVQKTPGAWVKELPHAQQYAITAMLDEPKQAYLEENRVPKKKPIYSYILGKLDFIAIDIPATLAYNVAIPFMAPFVFFYEFTTED